VKLRFGQDGVARTLYGEEINLAELGVVELRRASHVEPTRELSPAARKSLLDKHEDVVDHLTRAHNSREYWWADLLPMNGPVLGPFDTRTEALAAEKVWIEDHGIHPAQD
tara:strand:+ start:239 stop:568 length:330 start_codon:yes stop_codon:yes gene_type:complete